MIKKESFPAVDKFITFDVELAEELRDNGVGGESYGIAVATIGYHELIDGKWERRLEPVFNADGSPLTKEQCEQALNFLVAQGKDGLPIFTFNGSSFTFHIMFNNGCNPESCSNLAGHTFDIGYQILAIRGFMPGLTPLAAGAGYQMMAIDGKKVPVMWANGEIKAVIRQSKEHNMMLEAVVAEILKTGEVRWLSTRALPQKVEFPFLLMTLESYVLPEVDQSWMTNPLDKEEMIAWTFDAEGMVNDTAPSNSDY
jgi:hypothetical protein